MPGAAEAEDPAPLPHPGTCWGSSGSASPACVAVGVAGSRKSSSASELDMAPSWRRLSGSRPVTTTIPLALGGGRGFGRQRAGGREGPRASAQPEGGGSLSADPRVYRRCAASLTRPPSAIGRGLVGSALIDRKLRQPEAACSAAARVATESGSCCPALLRLAVWQACLSRAGWAWPRRCSEGDSRLDALAAFAGGCAGGHRSPTQ